MSRADIKRAEKGNIFRDGQIKDAFKYEGEIANAKILTKFMGDRRFAYDPKTYILPKCPLCLKETPWLVQRHPGKYEALCRHCYYLWEPKLELVK